MSVVLITGSNGLIGSEASLFFAELGFDIVGIDNDSQFHSVSLRLLYILSFTLLY